MAQMTQEQIDRRIAELGGSSLTHSAVAVKRRIANPRYNAVAVAAGRSNEPEFIEVDVQQWVSPTGHILQAYQNADGTWEVVQDEPPKPSTQKPTGTTQQIEGTPLGNGQFDNERPVMVTRRQDGTIVESRPLTPAEEKQWRESRERSRNPGGKTDAEIVAEGGTVRKPVAGRPNVYEVTTKQGTTTETHYEDAEGNRIPTPTDEGRSRKPVQGRPGVYEVTVTRGTTTETYYEDEAGNRVPGEQQSPYSQVVQDPETKRWWGLKKDGSGWVEVPGGPGAPSGRPTPAGPALPVLVVGQSQAALREYKQQLQAQVAAGVMTQTQADARWQEALTLARNAIDEATIVQRDEESLRNADVNLRTNAMSNATSGFTSALDFVSKINDRLPEGSTAGGQAFAAILGLQQLHAERMGSGRNEFSGGRPRSLEARGLDAAATTATATTATETGRLTAPPAAGAPAAPPETVTPEQAAAIQANPVFRPTPPVLRPPVNPALVQTDPQASAPPPAEEFAALAAYRPAAPVAAAPAAPAAPAMPALRAAQIAATPPWRLSDEDIEWAVANGLEDRLWSLPGRLA